MRTIPEVNTLISCLCSIRGDVLPPRQVPVDGLDAELFLIEANRQRVKTKVRRLQEYKRLKEIETAFAKERQKQGKAKLPDPKKSGQAREKAAETVGLKPRTAEKGLAVLNRAEATLSKPDGFGRVPSNIEIFVARNLLEAVCIVQFDRCSFFVRGNICPTKQSETVRRHRHRDLNRACVKHWRSSTSAWNEPHARMIRSDKTNVVLFSEDAEIHPREHRQVFLDYRRQRTAAERKPFVLELRALRCSRGLFSVRESFAPSEAAPAFRGAGPAFGRRWCDFIPQLDCPSSRRCRERRR